MEGWEGAGQRRLGVGLGEVFVEGGTEEITLGVHISLSVNI